MSWNEAPFPLPRTPPVLQLTPQANQLSVEFAALDYSAPERSRYAYRLLGYDDDWISVDPEHRLANYSNLPPGEYRLQLRGSNRNGEWSGRPREIPLSVLPAWYQTWWWRALVALLLGLVMYDFVLLRTSYLRRQPADPQRVRQMLGHLRVNAIKFSESGDIVIEANVQGAYLCLHISDPGIGMTEAEQKQLFAAFEQLDGSTTRRYGGLGLGLAICKKLVEAHHGHMHVHSAPDQDSCFTLLLPLAASSQI